MIGLLAVICGLLAAFGIEAMAELLRGGAALYPFVRMVVFLIAAAMVGVAALERHLGRRLLIRKGMDV